MRNKNFKDKSRQKTLISYTDNTKLIYFNLLEILDEIKIINEIRLIGVSLDNLKENTNEQIDIFYDKDLLNITNMTKKHHNNKDNTQNKNKNISKLKNIQRKNSKIIKEEKLDYIIDKLNKKYDKNIVKRARNIKKEH